MLILAAFRVTEKLTMIHEVASREAIEAHCFLWFPTYPRHGLPLAADLYGGSKNTAGRSGHKISNRDFIKISREDAWKEPDEIIRRA